MWLIARIVVQASGSADPILMTTDASIDVIGLTQFHGAREEASAFGVAPPNAKCLIDDTVHPCPLVPGEGSPEADCRVRAGKPVGVAPEGAARRVGKVVRKPSAAGLCGYLTIRRSTLAMTARARSRAAISA
jgi:hypothetical protein